MKKTVIIRKRNGLQKRIGPKDSIDQVVDEKKISEKSESTNQPYPITFEEMKAYEEKVAKQIFDYCLEKGVKVPKNSIYKCLIFA